MVQWLLYLGIILIGIVQVLSGLAIWKPVQFSELARPCLLGWVAQLVRCTLPMRYSDLACCFWL